MTNNHKKNMKTIHKYGDEYIKNKAIGMNTSEEANNSILAYSSVNYE